MKSLHRSILMLALAGAFVIVNVSHASGQFFFFENPLVGEAAPDFTLETLKGGKKSLHDSRNGDPAIIFFWATWCPHCRVQLRELSGARKELDRKDIEIVLVDLGEEANQVKGYMARNKMDFDVFLDKDSVVAEEYGVTGVPTFIYVSKDGVVQAVEHALVENYKEILEGE